MPERPRVCFCPLCGEPSPVSVSLVAPWEYRCRTCRAVIEMTRAQLPFGAVIP